MIYRSISDSALINFLNTFIIIVLSINARVSLICRSPSDLFRITVLSFHCLFNDLLKTLKMSSIGASDGVYAGMNAILAPHLSSRSKTLFVLCTLELSIVMIHSESLHPRSHSIHIRSLFKNLKNVFVLFLSTRGSANQ